jgi:hypothetical protein
MPENIGSSLEMAFKHCPHCRNVWLGRAEFLSDPKLRVAGYQVNFKALEEGLFLFEHLAPECHTTLAIPAHEFRDLYDGPVFESRMNGSSACPGYCLHKAVLESCPAECECAYVREVLRRIQAWPKKTGATAEKSA